MEKIKQFLFSEKGKDILMVIIIILVGLGSFELGRLSKIDNKANINIQYEGKTISNESNALSAVLSTQDKLKSLDSNNKAFFASNRGTKYYSLGCSAGKTIKQENRVYFATAEKAESAGYELSSSCR